MLDIKGYDTCNKAWVNSKTNTVIHIVVAAEPCVSLRDLTLKHTCQDGYHEWIRRRLARASNKNFFGNDLELLNTLETITVIIQEEVPIPKYPSYSF